MNYENIQIEKQKFNRLKLLLVTFKNAKIVL